MEADDDQATQATQNVLDPRRIGKQNSGFSDDDISDVICLLIPYSAHARREVLRIAREDPVHIVGRQEADAVDTDYTLEDDPSRFSAAIPTTSSDYAIVLKLSSTMKDPVRGFTFGRNRERCDVCFVDDPLRRLSNIHFRIYVNEYGVVMLEDQSTNGTIVDGNLLKARSRRSAESRRMLLSGSRIDVLMHKENLDLAFIVRIPRRDGDYDAAYTNKVKSFLNRVGSLAPPAVPPPAPPILPPPRGPIDLFPQQDAAAAAAATAPRPPAHPRLPVVPRPIAPERIPKEWTGSEKYNRVGIVGKGAFAVVYKVTSKFDGNPYAAKELEKRHFIRNGVLDQKVENEMRIMQRVKHPNIVRYIEHFEWDNRLLIIIMEYISGGDLGKFVHNHGPLPESVVQSVAAQLLSALRHLHENNITHRDIKPDNILISSHQPFEIKLTDFGLSKMVDNEQTFLRTFCGTLLYCAPEVYSDYADYDDSGRRRPRPSRARRPQPGQRYGHAVDVWSLGGVLFYILTGAAPYPATSGISHSELLHQIMTVPLNVLPLQRAGVSAHGIDFIRGMLQRRPDIRATLDELQRHEWLRGTEPDLPDSAAAVIPSSQSLDMITDDELEANASQLSLCDATAARQTALPDTEMPSLDDELMGEYSDEDSEKENHTFGPGNKDTQPRLFGEVNASAIGSSGVIAEDRLNLNLSMGESFGETIILASDAESEVPDSFESDHFTPGQRSQQPGAGGGAGAGASLSVAPQNQSADQLQSLVLNVESQSLGASASLVESLVDPNGFSSIASSLVGGEPTGPGKSVVSTMADFNTSKRKPNYDTSDEFDPLTTTRKLDKPTIKRLKSEVHIDTLSDELREEYRLLAMIPPIQRLESGRQIDRPVHKAYFWDMKDMTTFHLDYPEMTQLQLDVFSQAARGGGDVFGPASTGLWRVAMKYFPPTTDWSAVEGGKENTPPRRLDTDAGAVPPRTAGLRRDGRQLTILDVPATAPPPPTPSPPSNSDSPGGSGDENVPPAALPETQPIIVPVQARAGENQLIALIESAPDSIIQGISIPVTEAMLSWGRGLENTLVFPDKLENKVPKFALKLLLWKEGYDPSKDRVSPPWARDVPDADSYAFFISTKATNGIRINNRHLPSHDSRRPSSPSVNWIRLYNGDDLIVWGTDPAMQTKLTFRCFWGGSSADRPHSFTSSSSATVPPDQTSELVPSQTAKRLDELCLRAEKRLRAQAFYTQKMDEVSREHSLREQFVARERERSRLFEDVRREAVRHLASRRGSPAVVSGGSSESR